MHIDVFYLSLARKYGKSCFNSDEGGIMGIFELTTFYRYSQYELDEAKSVTSGGSAGGRRGC